MDVLTGLSEEFTNWWIDCNVRDPIKTQAMRVNKRKKRCVFFLFPMCSQQVLKRFSESSQRVPQNVPNLLSQWGDEVCNQEAQVFLKILWSVSWGCYNFLFFYVPKGFLTSPNLFPKTFPIVRYFYPLCFAQSCPIWVDQRVGTLYLYLQNRSFYLGEPSTFQCFFFWWWANQIDSLPKKNREKKCWTWEAWLKVGN